MQDKGTGRGCQSTHPWDNVMSDNKIFIMKKSRTQAGTEPPSNLGLLGSLERRSWAGILRILRSTQDRTHDEHF